MTENYFIPANPDHHVQRRAHCRFVRMALDIQHTWEYTLCTISTRRKMGDSGKASVQRRVMSCCWLINKAYSIPFNNSFPACNITKVLQLFCISNNRLRKHREAKLILPFSWGCNTFHITETNTKLMGPELGGKYPQCIIDEKLGASWCTC